MAVWHCMAATVAVIGVYNVFWMAQEAAGIPGRRCTVGGALAHGSNDEVILAAMKGRKKSFANRIREFPRFLLLISISFWVLLQNTFTKSVFAEIDFDQKLLENPLSPEST